MPPPRVAVSRRVHKRPALCRVCFCFDVLGRLCDLGCDVAHKIRSLGYKYGLNLVGTWLAKFQDFKKSWKCL